MEITGSFIPGPGSEYFRDHAATGASEQNFQVLTEDGEFVNFTGVLEGGAWVDGQYTASIREVKIIERGNIYAREGSD